MFQIAIEFLSAIFMYKVFKYKCLLNLCVIIVVILYMLFNLQNIHFRRGIIKKQRTGFNCSILNPCEGVISSIFSGLYLLCILYFFTRFVYLFRLGKFYEKLVKIHESWFVPYIYKRENFMTFHM